MKELFNEYYVSYIIGCGYTNTKILKTCTVFSKISVEDMTCNYMESILDIMLTFKEGSTLEVEKYNYVKSCYK